MANGLLKNLRTFPVLLFLICFAFAGMVGEVVNSSAPSGGSVATGDPVSHSMPIQPVLPYLFPDIAFTPAFRAAGLNYVHSAGFADAMWAVATGTSRYSPGSIPAWWARFVREWSTQLRSCGCSREVPGSTASSPPGSKPDIRFAIRTLLPRTASLSEGEDRIPALFFLASLEYRTRTGRKGTPLMYPSYLRMAVEEVVSSVRKKLEEGAVLQDRLHGVAARILTAERAGAPEKFPRELAFAKAELHFARHASGDGTFDLKEAERSIALAEAAANRLPE